ncbi:MAG: tRNA (adenosine(37)-N6)-threonylcarbamoyltransferase complex ATPase subunit type 1 TsaE [Armatimonadota bacterium]
MEDGRECPANNLITMVVSHGPDFAELITETDSVEETRALACRLGRELSAGDFVALSGTLGAGKTAFVQGLAAGLGSEGTVTSPTFVLMRLHHGPIPLAHADAYRLSGAADLEDLGLGDWMGESVIALEWADTVPDAIPSDRIEVHIEYADDGRRLRIRGFGRKSANVVREIKRQHEDTSGDVI